MKKKNKKTFKYLYYLKVWFAIVMKSLSKSLAFRFEFASKIFRMILMVALQIILVKSLYSGTEYIKGWSIGEYYLLIGTFNFINYLSWGIFNINLWRLEEKIIKGEFDSLLLLPTGSVFSSAFSEFFLDDALGSLSGVVLIAYYFVGNWDSIIFINVIGYLLALVIAFIIWFNIHLFFSAVNFVAVKNGLMDLIKNLTRVGSFPIDIFTESLRFVLYSIFPVAFIAAVPSRILSGASKFDFLLLGLLVCVITTLIARNFWHYCIRSYTSSGG